MRIVLVTKQAAEPAARLKARALARKSASRRTARAPDDPPPAPELVSPRRLRAVLSTLASGDLLYVDLSAFPSTQALARLRKLLSPSGPVLGVVDPGGLVHDVAGLFHAGAVDYLDRAAWRKGLTPKRLLSVIAYARASRRSAPAQGAGAEPQIVRPLGRAAVPPSGGDWSAIREGERYIFSLVFVELDGAEELERRYGAADLAEALASFRSWIERSATPFNGRIWIWSRFGGIVLFPFDGEREQAAPCLFRMCLFQRMYDVEESRFPHFISCRLAAHHGELVWRERQTGTLVAEALNTAFHLGQRYTPRGGCSVTDEIYRLQRPPLQAFFSPAGEFEGRRIWRLRQPRA